MPVDFPFLNTLDKHSNADWMNRTKLILELPEEILRKINERARRTGKSREEVARELLER